LTIKIIHDRNSCYLADIHEQRVGRFVIGTILQELEPYTTGRPRTTDLREILNAIFYLNKTGCPWRYLPKDFPSYTLVNYYYNKWTDNRTLEKVNAVLRQHLREKKGRSPDPTAAIIALPTKPPKLELDILNPHYQPYYTDPLKHFPADYYSPVPVFFLTVAPGQSFRFALGTRPGVAMAQADWRWLWKILGDALQCIGAGGKTAVGYGYMTNFEEQTEKQASEWLQAALDDLRHDKDYKGLAEQELWKKGLSEKYLLAPKGIKPVVLEMIQKKWKEFGLDWNNPKKGSARTAVKNYESN